MSLINVVLDTNVLVAALRSNGGASNRLLQMVGGRKLTISISVALFLEYESVLQRQVEAKKINKPVAQTVLAYIAKVARQQKIHYLWRPYLPDASDDMVLELAVASGSEAIVTFNKRDFAGIEKFNVDIIAPFELLERIGEI